MPLLDAMLEKVSNSYLFPLLIPLSNIHSVFKSVKKMGGGWSAISWQAATQAPAS